LLTPNQREQFYDLHLRVKQLLKGGCIRHSTLKEVEVLHDFINRHAAEISKSCDRGDEDRLIELWHVKSLCMIAEIYDQFGRVKEARAACSDGIEFFGQLLTLMSETSEIDDRDKPVLREKVRLCVDYAQTHYYRDHDYAAAKDLVFRCLKFVKTKLQDVKSFACFGTLGQGYYFAGKVLRQEGDYDQAVRFFSLAIENYFHRAEQKVRELKNGSPAERERLSQELALSTLKSGIALGLGIGWVNYARGRLRQAMYDNINPARVLLLHASDELSAAYVDLIYAAITRALHTTSKRKLEEALGLAKKSYDTFRRNRHRRYTGRAAWEMGLTLFYSGRLDEAAKMAKKVQDIARQSKDPRWVCNALILRSRIERRRAQLGEPGASKRYAAAQRYATRAYTTARTYKQLMCEINALLTRSAARVDSGDFPKARADACAALKRNSESDDPNASRAANPKLEALCYLSIARTYAREGEGLKAQEYFSRWKALETEVEHIFVRELADAVEEEINALNMDFVIKAYPELDLDSKRWVKELKRFLVGQAKRREHEKRKVAALLGITRQTLSDWEKDFEKE
jgi:tetratricopeptide (TPR) repeat protein